MYIFFKYFDFFLCTRFNNNYNKEFSNYDLIIYLDYLKFVLIFIFYLSLFILIIKNIIYLYNIMYNTSNKKIKDNINNVSFQGSIDPEDPKDPKKKKWYENKKVWLGLSVISIIGCSLLYYFLSNGNTVSTLDDNLNVDGIEEGVQNVAKNIEAQNLVNIGIVTLAGVTTNSIINSDIVLNTNINVYNDSDSDIIHVENLIENFRSFIDKGLINNYTAKDWANNLELQEFFSEFYILDFDEKVYVITNLKEELDNSFFNISHNLNMAVIFKMQVMLLSDDNFSYAYITTWVKNGVIDEHLGDLLINLVKKDKNLGLGLVDVLYHCKNN